jgi:hypothetical protein
MPERCWFCAEDKSGLPHGPLCDKCRNLLSDFLVWMGRRPLPQREKMGR